MFQCNNKMDSGSESDYSYLSEDDDSSEWNNSESDSSCEEDAG